MYSQGARVKYFDKCFGGWKWPKQIDEIDYLPKDIKKKIQFPEPINNCGNWRADGGAKMCTTHLELNDAAVIECFKLTYKVNPYVVMIF